jgi:hypothetical protein
VSNNSSTTRFISLLFVLVVTAALVGVDLVVLAQDANTAAPATMQSGNTATTNTRRTRRRAGRRKAKAGATSGDTSGNTNASAPADSNANAGTNTGDMSVTGGTKMRGKRRRGKAAAAAAPAGPLANENTSGGDQTDLSGTYTGRVNAPDFSMTGDATLTVTGNQFTLTSGSATQTGRVTAVTTRGYTGVTMQFGTATPSVGGQPGTTPTMISLRAKRTGGGLWLAPVAGETHQFTFSTSGGGKRGRRGKKAAAAAAADTTGAAEGPAADANANTSGAAAPTTTNTGAPRRARRRGRRAAAPATTNDMGGNMNSGAASNSNMQ